jgi:PIN domain nuclease of toxin-antitoxin system
MKILLDTHIFLWAISAPDKLPDKWQFELESQANLVYFSAISVAEIMFKSSIGKLNVQFDPIDIAVKSGFELLDFTAHDALLLKDMPFHHRDPFDRMLIAQGMQNRMSLMTDDSKFRLYKCRLFR